MTALRKSNFYDPVTDESMHFKPSRDESDLTDNLIQLEFGDGDGDEPDDPRPPGLKRSSLIKILLMGMAFGSITYGASVINQSSKDRISNYRTSIESIHRSDVK